jgi:hypothetical protein
LISLSPLPTAHPSFLQQTAVQASSACYGRFALAMGRSLRFGSILRNWMPSSDSLSLRLRLSALTLLRKITRRLIKQKAHDQAFPCGHSPFVACRCTVSGSISLPSPGFFSPFPHGTGALSVISEYLALERGRPGFPQGVSGPVVLRSSLQQVRVVSPTGLSPSLAGHSRPLSYDPDF